jgi:hypothetical protein
MLYNPATSSALELTPLLEQRLYLIGPERDDGAGTREPVAMALRTNGEARTWTSFIERSP